LLSLSLPLRRVRLQTLTSVVRDLRCVDPGYNRNGIASWNGRDFHGRLTANGEVYDMNGISAAHPMLPLPSFVRVNNLESNRSIVVRPTSSAFFERGRRGSTCAMSALLRFEA
jgi:rare lipoprotein A